MNLYTIKNTVKKNAFVSGIVHKCITKSSGAAPRRWTKWLVNPFVHQVKGSIRFSVRRDLFAFQPFKLGTGSVIESFSVVNK